MDAIHPLKTYRKQEKLTQKGLADLLGVKRETVARWETGLREPADDNLVAIAEKTGIQPPALRRGLAKLNKPVDAAQ